MSQFPLYFEKPPPAPPKSGTVEDKAMGRVS